MAGHGAEKKRWVHTGPDKPCPYCVRNIDLGFVDIDFLYTSVFGPSTASGPPAHPGVDHCHIEFDENELVNNADKLEVWDGGDSPAHAPFGTAIRPGNFHTLEEAQQWIDGTKNVEYNLHGIHDVGFANQVLKVIERVSTKYSHIGFDLTYVDGALIEETLTALDESAERWPEAMEGLEYFGTYMAVENGKVVPPLGPEPFGGAIAHAGLGKEIGLNPDYWDDEDYLRDVLGEAYARNWSVSPEPRGTIHHEFGHIVQNWWSEQVVGKTLVPYVRRIERTPYGIRGNDTGYMTDILDEWIRQVRPDRSLSDYGLTSVSEAWAESFAAMATQPKSEWPLFVERLKQMIDWSLDDRHFDPTEWTDIPSEIKDMENAGASDEEIEEFVNEAFEAAEHARTEALEILGLDEFDEDRPMFEVVE